MNDFEDSEEGQEFGFINGVEDSYDLTNSAGYIYEETKCREIEHNVNEKEYDHLDWSWDTTNENQGKRWKTNELPHYYFVP